MNIETSSASRWAVNIKVVTEKEKMQGKLYRKKQRNPMSHLRKTMVRPVWTMCKSKKCEMRKREVQQRIRRKAGVQRKALILLMQMLLVRHRLAGSDTEKVAMLNKRGDQETIRFKVRDETQDLQKEQAALVIIQILLESLYLLTL